MMNNIYLEALRELVSVFPVPIAKYPEACKKVHAALSQKPRNCDVGTAKEQYRRFCYCCTKHKMPCRRSYTFGCAECYSKWAQMPYEEALEK